jgi:hypothetical protein
MLLVGAVRCPGPAPLTSTLVGVVKGVLKRVLKSILIAVALSLVARVATRLRNARDAALVSFDDWPDVPSNPAA